MQQQITWTSRYYQSTERLVLSTHAGRHIATSAINGHYNGKLFDVNYTVEINSEWQLEQATVTAQFNNARQQIDLSKTGNQWYINGTLADIAGDVFDIDISATPFTNTLPINRLKLPQGERRIIEVVYIDLFEQQLTTMKQVYTNLGGNKYLYQNYDGSFQAEITVDDTGLVVEYPQLFKLSGKTQIGE